MLTLEQNNNCLEKIYFNFLLLIFFSFYKDPEKINTKTTLLSTTTGHLKITEKVSEPEPYTPVSSIINTQQQHHKQHLNKSSSHVNATHTSTPTTPPTSAASTAPTTNQSSPPSLLATASDKSTSGSSWNITKILNKNVRLNLPFIIRNYIIGFKHVLPFTDDVLHK